MSETLGWKGTHTKKREYVWQVYPPSAMLADNLTQVRDKKGLVSNSPTTTAQTKQTGLNRQINQPLGRVHYFAVRSGAKLVYHGR
jgi:hypothetical protein